MAVVLPSRCWISMARPNPSTEVAIPWERTVPVLMSVVVREMTSPWRFSTATVRTPSTTESPSAAGAPLSRVVIFVNAVATLPVSAASPDEVYR